MKPCPCGASATHTIALPARPRRFVPVAGSAAHADGTPCEHDRIWCGSCAAAEAGRWNARFETRQLAFAL